MTSIENLYNDLRSGSRVALSKAITLIESQRKDHQKEAEKLLSGMQSLEKKVPRIAISGPPGVGKSTLIEALGLHLIDIDLKIAVLTIDPSSQITKGSILGDKTRMENLSKSDSAFIRQTPSSNQLGGIAPHTRETIWLCEQAGYDVVLVETVGVGQSEYEVHKLCDIMIYIGLPGSGDELQGVKKGILEVADIFVINKADGVQKELANITRKQLSSALHLGRGKYDSIKREVMSISAIERNGIDELWTKVNTLFGQLIETDLLTEIRNGQMKLWLDELIQFRWRQVLDQSEIYRTRNIDDKIENNQLEAIYKYVNQMIKSVNEEN